MSRSFKRKPVLVLLEGQHDISFLRAISKTLHQDDKSLPDLSSLEARKQVLFIPFGGSNITTWSSLFGNLDCPEFHLYDRETEPVTSQRLQIQAQVNQRENCRAFVTSKRALENYLHPKAIYAASDLQVAVNDHDDIADKVAQVKFNSTSPDILYRDLPSRAKKRLRNTVKKMLNVHAVNQMTAALLEERDPQVEVITWLSAIQDLLAE